MYDNYLICKIILTSVQSTIGNYKNPQMYDNFRAPEKVWLNALFPLVSSWVRLLSIFTVGLISAVERTKEDSGSVIPSPQISPHVTCGPSVWLVSCNTCREHLCLCRKFTAIAAHKTSQNGCQVLQQRWRRWTHFMWIYICGGNRVSDTQQMSSFTTLWQMEGRESEMQSVPGLMFV